MSKYITVNEAVEYTNKSTSTIRRLIDKLKRENSPHLRTEKKRTEKYGQEKFAQVHYLNKDFLRKYYSLEMPAEVSNEGVDDTEKQQAHPVIEREIVSVVEVLQQTIKEKDKQISELQQEKAELKKDAKDFRDKYDEAMTRYVVLVDDVRRKLLPEAKLEEEEVKHDDKHDTQGEIVVEKEKSIDRSKQTQSKQSKPKAKKPKKQEKKKGLFGRIFG